MRGLTLALLVAGASLLFVGCQTQAPTPAEPKPAQAAEPASSVFEPAKGVRCDRSAKICEYKGGPTVGLTRLFFGDAAADGLAPRMSAKGYPFDPIFKPTPRASCDTLVTACYDEGGASVSLTESYFGGEAGARLEKRMRAGGSSDAVVRYGDYITCDQMSGVCYDRLGAGVVVTQMYLSQEAGGRPAGPSAAPQARAAPERPRSRDDRGARDSLETAQVGGPAEALHQLQDLGGTLARVGPGVVGPQAQRVRQHRRQQRRLLRFELGRADVEEATARRLHAEDAGSELGHVQIHLEDASLGPGELDPDREPRLEPLAQQASARPQEEVLRQLLRDRARPAQASLFLALFHGLGDGPEVEAPVLAKALILGENDGDGDVGGDLLPVDPALLDALAGPARRRIGEVAAQHEGARRRRDAAEEGDRDRGRERGQAEAGHGEEGASAHHAPGPAAGSPAPPASLAMARRG